MDIKEALRQEEKNKVIRETLKHKDHSFVFSDSLIIHHPRTMRTAIKFNFLKEDKVIGPMSNFHTNFAQWKNSKSVSCESGIYAIPLATFNSDNLFESLLIKSSSFSLISLLEYSDPEDIIYQSVHGLTPVLDVLNEVCLRCCNIVYSGTSHDYVANSEKALEDFKLELYTKFWRRPLV